MEDDPQPDRTWTIGPRPDEDDPPAWSATVFHWPAEDDDPLVPEHWTWELVNPEGTVPMHGYADADPSRLLTAFVAVLNLPGPQMLAVEREPGDVRCPVLVDVLDRIRCALPAGHDGDHLPLDAVLAGREQATLLEQARDLARGLAVPHEVEARDGEVRVTADPEVEAALFGWATRIEEQRADLSADLAAAGSTISGHATVLITRRTPR